MSNIRINITVSLLVILITALTVLRFYLLDSLVEKGEQLYDLQEQLKLVKRENMILREEIYNKSSLIYIEQLARQLGFIDGVQYVLK